LIGLVIIDFFSPDQRMRNCERPINLGMDPKNDVGFFGVVPSCDSPERIVTTLLLYPSSYLAMKRTRSVSLRVFLMSAKKVFDAFCLRVTNEKSFLRETYKVKGAQKK